MDEILWLMGFIFMFMLAIGYVTKHEAMLIFSGIFGIVFGLSMFAENEMISVILLLLSLYTIYQGTDNE